MDEQQVRLLVRQAIARHMGAPPPAAAPLSMASAPVSFSQFQLVRPAGETDCIIEPAVTCNHCGHGQCSGH